MDVHVHVIAGVAVLSRVADIWTTYLVTPTLKMEGNAIARRLGWPYALATVLIGFLAYVSAGLGVVVLTASFLVAAANAGKILMARALGEEQMAALAARVLRATNFWSGLFYLILPGVFTAMLGGSLLIFYHYPDEWGYYFAAGMFTYSLAVFVWYPLRFVRSKKRSKSAVSKGRGDDGVNPGSVRD